MNPNHYRPAVAGDLFVGRRVFVHDLQGGAQHGTITGDGPASTWSVTPDAGRFAGESVGMELSQLAVFADELQELEQYHAAALAHLETVQPRPMHQMTERDAEAYHAYGDTPAECAEMWAESTLYELEHDDEYPAPLPAEDPLPGTEPAPAGGWQQDAQHGPYVAESTPDGTVARVMHYPSPYSTERYQLAVFAGDDAWREAMADAWRRYRNERPTYAGR